MTPNTWPKAKLGDVLEKSAEWVEIDPTQRYKLVTARLWGKGIVERSEKLGSEIGDGRKARIRAGQFILSKIDARNGAMGIVPPGLDGAVVSNDFPTFNLRTDALLPDYLDWISKTRNFVHLCWQASEGTTNRVRLKEERFLSMSIPLPPLAEQRRIVSRLVELVARIAGASKLRQDSLNLSHKLVGSHAADAFLRLSQDHPLQHLGALSLHITSGPRNWSKYYSPTGQRFYRAQDIGPYGLITNHSKVFVTPPAGLQGRSATLAHGDLMLVITGATVGRVAVFHTDIEAGLVNQHVAICRLPKDAILPEFALWALRSPEGQRQIIGQRYGQGKPGLNLTNIRGLRVPVPPLSIQSRVIAALDDLERTVTGLLKLQAATHAGIDALLPSVLDKAFQAGSD